MYILTAGASVEQGLVVGQHVDLSLFLSWGYDLLPYYLLLITKIGFFKVQPLVICCLCCAFIKLKCWLLIAAVGSTTATIK